MHLKHIILSAWPQGSIMRSTLAGNIPTWVIHMPPFVLQPSEKWAKLASAKYQMATEALIVIIQPTAKVYHPLCMAPGQHDGEYFGW